MRVLLLFTTAACSAAPAAQAPVRPPPPVAMLAPDAALAEPPRGATCEGFCGPPCGNGEACDGACVESETSGSFCLARCTQDADCRTTAGYTCDPIWHACTLPNTTALVPRTCSQVGPARDTTFGDSEPWAVGAEPSAIAAGSGFVALYETATGIGGTGQPAIATGASDPSLARGRGALFAVWADEHQVSLASSPDGSAWSSPAPVQAPGDAAGTPAIAIGPDPAKHAPEIAYVLYGAPGQGLRVRASHDATVTFGPAVTAARGSRGRAAIGGDGRLHVVALDGGVLGGYGSAQQRVEYTVSGDAGATFAKPVVASGRDEVLPFHFATPAIAVDDRRRLVYIAYLRGGRDGVWDVVLATTKDAGQTWTRTAIGDGCAIHLVPSLAVDPTTGTVHLAWYDTAGGPRFAHATCASGGAKCSVLGAIDTRPFDGLSLAARKSARWIGERASLFVDDKLRVLHAVWTQPVTEDGRVVPRIFHATAKLKK